MNKYRVFLMNKDNQVASFIEHRRLDDYTYTLETQFDSNMPKGFDSMNSWLNRRQAVKHKKHMAEMMKECGIYNKRGFIDMTRCAVLTDTFWVKREGDALQWSEVSLYQNNFDEVVSRIAFNGIGLYGRQFSSTIPTPDIGTDGSFDKCWIREDDGSIYLLKRGSTGAINTGKEPYSEKLCSQLLDFLGYEHVAYDLAMFYGKLASKCPIFTSEELGYAPMYDFSTRGMDTYDVYDFMDTHGLLDDFKRMILFDTVSMNVDRHMGNYGFLIHNDTGEIRGMAPLFDHNMALLPYLMEQDDFEEYISLQGPRLGGDFIPFLRSMMDSSLQRDLIRLKDFSFSDPGFEYPKWKLETANRIVQRQVALALGETV